MIYGKQFVYIHIDEGGATEIIIHNAESLKSIYGWMGKSVKSQDNALKVWMKTATPGEWFSHRLGWMFCVITEVSAY